MKGRNLRAFAWRPGSGIHGDRMWVGLVALAAVLPSLIWIALDKTPFFWDPAFYGKHSVELFLTLVHSPAAWVTAMLNVLGRMAPGIAWIGQFFVPVGLAIGSIDTGLLLSIVLAQVTALVLTSLAAWELSGRKLEIALTGLAVMGSAPLFIALGHFYLVEMMQTAAVAWFVLIMARAPRWSRPRIASQLLLATSFAMLSKVSSPLYCFVPGLVAVYYVVRPESPVEPPHGALPFASLASGLVVCTATAAWYYRNLQTVAAHLSMAATGSVAELYGKQEGFLLTMKYWLSAAATNFFSLPVAVLAGGSLLVAAVVSVSTRHTAQRKFVVAVGVAALQIVTVLTVCSLSSNRDNRYLLPLLPYVVVLVAWSVWRLNRRPVTYALVAAFGVQWAHAEAQSVGLLNPAPGAVVWFQPKSSDGRSRARLDALVARTCADRTTATYWNAVGVQLLSLNPPAVSYAAAKALASGHSLNCDYDAIGYYDNDEERSWNLLMSRKITYYIAVDPSVHKIPSTLVDTTVNQLNEPIRRRIEKSGLFELEPGLDGYEGILIFRRVDQIDHVANGRALSDQGLQQQAIDELNKATQLEPANVEAWANLALVHERNGSLEEALSAGGRARALAADHYYVNLGLARVLLQRKEWSTAVRRAEDAAAHSPGLAEKVNAIVIAAEASFQARDAAAGCKFLMTAASLRSDRSILEGLERNRCGK